MTERLPPQSQNFLLLLSDSHDVGFVDGHHAVSLVVSGVFKGVLSDASAGVLCDQFDALNDAINDLQQGEGEEGEEEGERQSRKMILLNVFRGPSLTLYAGLTSHSTENSSSVSH